MSAITVHAFRWAPGERERRQTYAVTAGPDTTVLDALVEIQRGQDQTLAFRYACRVGMCGSCAMVVNGRERWACRTRLAALGSDVVDVRPLYHFPLLRDLVVDMTPFHQRLRAVGAALVPRESAAAERWRVLLSDDALARCHGQGNCTVVCPMELDGASSIARLRRLAVGRLFGAT